MSYKLYTTYLANMKNIADTCKTAIIMRFPPFIPKDGDTIHCIELSPKGELLSEYKKDNDYEKFKEKLFEQFNNNKENGKLMLDYIQETLDNYNDVCLVCCEKDFNICHRKIIGEYFEEFGYEWEEL